MGCPHDYAHFESKILPLVKRAQEGAVQHTGKVPTKIEHTEMTREVTTTRLRRELQKAIHAERYEDAARLRDALSKMGFATS
jgi:protein arginine kinase activator